MYAIAQKDRMGLDKAVEDSKYAMKRYGVSPNLLVIPPQVNQRLMFLATFLCSCLIATCSNCAGFSLCAFSSRFTWRSPRRRS